jgi:hypothetical protein
VENGLVEFVPRILVYYREVMELNAGKCYNFMEYCNLHGRISTDAKF